VNFCSDNASGAAPEILRALEAANDGWAMPYGDDDLTRRLQARVEEIFETEAAVLPVATGTAANPSTATGSPTSTSTNAARRSSTAAAPSWSRCPAIMAS
jgi:threonine aldolase